MYLKALWDSTMMNANNLWATRWLMHESLSRVCQQLQLLNLVTSQMLFIFIYNLYHIFSYKNNYNHNLHRKYISNELTLVTCMF